MNEDKKNFIPPAFSTTLQRTRRICLFTVQHVCLRNVLSASCRKRFEKNIRYLSIEHECFDGCSDVPRRAHISLYVVGEIVR